MLPREVLAKKEETGEVVIKSGKLGMSIGYL